MQIRHWRVNVRCFDERVWSKGYKFGRHYHTDCLYTLRQNKVIMTLSTWEDHVSSEAGERETLRGPHPH